MTPTFAAKLGLFTQPIGIDVQKIDSSLLAMYAMIVVGFSLQNSQKNIWFF